MLATYAAESATDHSVLILFRYPPVRFTRDLRALSGGAELMTPQGRGLVRDVRRSALRTLRVVRSGVETRYFGHSSFVRIHVLSGL
jgi:hypothetical protein